MFYLATSDIHKNVHLTFDNANCTKRGLDPTRSYEPLLNIGNDSFKIFRVTFHNTIELHKLSWPEENFCDAKLEVFVIELQWVQHCLKQNACFSNKYMFYIFFSAIWLYLAKDLRLQLNKLWRQEWLVHVVQLSERNARWIPILH